jgi:surface protein
MDAYAEEIPFITTWSMDDLSLEIPTTGTGYNYTINWGDGTTIDTAQTGDAFHTYDSAGNYTVSISGDFPRIYLYNSDSAEKLVSIDQWGDIEWTSMSFAFYGARNMNLIAIDVPDLSRVIDMSAMFYNADSFNGDISNWDTSSVTDMSSMFNSIDSFNGDISNWDTSSVTDMRYMFTYAVSFNGDISNWDTSSVTDMKWMFNSAVLFNGDISNWDTSSVTDMGSMLTNTSLSTNNYDKILDKWSQLPTLQNNVNFDSSSKYCDAGEIGRIILTDTYSWIIADEGLDADEVCDSLGVP